MTSPSKWVASADQTKQGMTFLDHHYKPADGDGKVQRSPPPKLKSMYDYLPNDGQASSPKAIPMKLEVSCGNPTEASEQLDIQLHCCGVYHKIPSSNHRDNPVWKHCGEDLAVHASLCDGEKCWVISKHSTYTTKEQVRMRLISNDAPWKSKAVWKAFQKGDMWKEAPACRMKPTYHGYGQEAKGTEMNSNSSVSPSKGGGGGKKPTSPA